ncbi:hypothetical protein, partial [Neisseria gonorrhoeae]|uniref:hypothetical protein n=1 Tax=Neisseria gonorrhoeae TaxID=485 RepID=UPI00384EDAEE
FEPGDLLPVVLFLLVEFVDGDFGKPVLAVGFQQGKLRLFQTALHHWLDGVLCAPDLSYALAHQSDLGTHQIWLTPEGHQV